MADETWFRMDEIHDLHATIERLEEQKNALEEQAAEQAETCKQLNEANDALSAKTLTLAAEAAAAAAASGPAAAGGASADQIKKLEQQLVAAQKELADLNDLLDRTTMAEANQRVALLDELNTLQQENGTLRNQLRQIR